MGNPDVESRHAQHDRGCQCKYWAWFGGSGVPATLEGAPIGVVNARPGLGAHRGRVFGASVRLAHCILIGCTMDQPLEVLKVE